MSKELDDELEAIRRTAKVLSEKIDSGEIANREDLVKAKDEELAFQRIAVKEEG